MTIYWVNNLNNKACEVEILTLAAKESMAEVRIVTTGTTWELPLFCLRDGVPKGYELVPGPIPAYGHSGPRKSKVDK